MACPPAPNRAHTPGAIDPGAAPYDGSVSATHIYEVLVEWTGSGGSGTTSYRSYSRDHEIRSAGKQVIAGSSDAAFLGDPDRWNPEELLVAALSQCHMLWYLHLAASAGIVVISYKDLPVGTMTELPDGAGQFTEVLLRPSVTVTEQVACARATTLHDDAERLCFIARSVNFPVRHEPVTTVGAKDST